MNIIADTKDPRDPETMSSSHKFDEKERPLNVYCKTFVHAHPHLYS